MPKMHPSIPRGNHATSSIFCQWDCVPNGVKLALSVTALIVSVATLLGVTEDGETRHVGIGEAPATAQESATGSAKLLKPVMVKASLACWPVCIVTVGEAAVSVKSETSISKLALLFSCLRSG